jgi:hypothetical protein
LSSFSAGESGLGVAAPPPVVVEEHRQLAVLAAHVATVMRRLASKCATVGTRVKAETA